jgi:hypothetical protein
MRPILFSGTARYRVWTYAILFSVTDPNTGITTWYIKYGDHRCETVREVEEYLSSETVGKFRGTISAKNVIGIWDMTEDAVKRDYRYDPTLTDENYKRGYDNAIRDLMPLKKNYEVNHVGQRSLELHKVPDQYLIDYPDGEWVNVLRREWADAHQKILNGEVVIGPQKIYDARDYLERSLNKIANVNKFLLAGATGSGKETSTLALLVQLHVIKQFNNRVLHVAVATIPSTISELMNELATVKGMNTINAGYIDFSRIKIYITEQWFNTYRKDCSTEAQMMLLSKATIVKKVSDIPTIHEDEIVPVLFGSYHDLALKSNDKMNNRYAGLSNRIGVLSIGEAHQMLGRADNKMWKNLASVFGSRSFKLFVTGTPYDFIYGNAAAEYFPTEERELFTRNDLYADKRNNPDSFYKEYPDFNYYGINVEEIVNCLRSDPNWVDDAEGFTWQKFFTFERNTNKFKYEQSVLWLFKRMFGSNAFNENGDPLSIYNAPNLCEKAKQHILCALPIGSNGVSAQEYIGELKNLIISHGIFQGEVFDAYQDGLGDRKDDIAAAIGRTLTLTCVKDCTGANIPDLGSFVMLRNIGNSVKFFEQATGRVGRRSADKNNCGVFIGDLEAAMNLVVDVEEKISLERGLDFSTSEIIENVLANYNFFTGRNGSWEQLNMPDLAKVLEDLSARGNYGVNQCVVKTTAPDDFDLNVKSSGSSESQNVAITSNNNKGAKNKDITKNKTQLGLTFDDNKNNRDASWEALKRNLIAKCRVLAFHYEVKTVQECISLVESGDPVVLSLIGQGAEYIGEALAQGEIDVSYTNRWIDKFNSKKSNPEWVFEEFADKIYHDSVNGYVPEPLSFVKKGVNDLLNKIQQDSTTIKYIIDPAAGRGAFLYCFIKLARERNIDFDINNVYYNDNDGFAVSFFKTLNRTAKLGIPDENVTCEDFLTKEFNMKFSVVLGNPPYQGKAELHQKFFNKAVDLLEDGGIVSFIQPATPYFNKKENIRSNAKDMIDNVKKYKTEVTIIDSAVFEEAQVFTDLAITILEKTEYNPGNLESFRSKSGNFISNASIEAVNMLDMAPNFYLSLVKKIKNKIAVNGTLQELISTNQSQDKFYIQKVRGHIGHVDFYTMISSNSKYWTVKQEHEYGIVLEPTQVDSIVSYLKSFVARFSLAIYKFNGNNHMGELRSVPIIPFDRIWNDKLLCEYFEITDEEYAEILRCIPDYYSLGNNLS